MRCPYCGGLNSERASFCAQCGRDLVPPTQANTRQQPPQSPYQPQRQQPVRPSFQPQRPASPPSVPPYQQPRQAPQPASGQVSHQNVRLVPSPPPTLQPVQAPEPPVQFPPHSIEQLRALESDALPYTVVSDEVGDGRKKIVRIVYRPCIQWQQVATLLKAFNEQQSDKFDTILVQGMLEQDPGAYNFTNGQLRFDRNVRLGSQVINRYQIETGNGLESDSVRIVLSE